MNLMTLPTLRAILYTVVLIVQHCAMPRGGRQTNHTLLCERILYKKLKKYSCRKLVLVSQMSCMSQYIITKQKALHNRQQQYTKMS